jgi:hypothetical protein
MKTPVFLLLVLIPICVFGKKVARLLPRREPLPQPVSEILSISDVRSPGFEIVEPGVRTKGDNVERELKFKIVGSDDNGETFSR